MIYTISQTHPYPIYDIDLAKLSKPADVLWIMKNIKATMYVYTFSYLDRIIKHGISIDKKSLYGERIYRQAGHLDGWEQRLYGPSGDDMVYINADFFAKTGEHLNRLGMKITVRDLTNVESPSASDPAFHVKKLERELIKEYQNKNGCLPIGNVKDEAYMDSKSYVSKDRWSSMFSFDQ